MDMCKIIIFIICVSITLGNSQLLDFGPCPDTQAKPYFNFTAFLGKWYEIAKYMTYKEIGDKCVRMTFTNDSGEYSMTLQRQRFFNNEDITEHYKVKFPLYALGDINIFLHVLPDDSASYLTILDTDYTNWALVYSCYDFMGFFKFQYAWLLARQRFFIPIMFDPEKIARDHGLTLHGFMMWPTNQLTCPLIY